MSGSSGIVCGRRTHIELTLLWLVYRQRKSDRGDRLPVISRAPPVLPSGTAPKSWTLNLAGKYGMGWSLPAASREARWRWLVRSAGQAGRQAGRQAHCGTHSTGARPGSRVSASACACSTLLRVPDSAEPGITLHTTAHLHSLRSSSRLAFQQGSISPPTCPRG